MPEMEPFRNEVFGKLWWNSQMGGLAFDEWLNPTLGTALLHQLPFRLLIRRILIS